MPFLNNDNKPSFLNKQTPNISQRGIDKKPIFPKPQIPNFERDLDKNTRFLEELARESGLEPESSEMKVEIERVKEKMSNFSKRSMAEEYWNEKHYLEEKLKGGITTQESKEIARRKKINQFLNKKFGIK
ncbi:MAG: hypothetical protein A3C58_00040 [Candidatus Staskawiczbacteria bacterium RIFCSPHIGHO2_02_FULL_34_10]|uniref:Uncharacterized protein n=2 Tax=Candidatus Staskawicziibacteriota TaxID=1817916 RepID=A0A1G2HL53_9BACT|nr:MAG: hypothetical protein A2639_03295 [Candidatus Staskawiczbacteria bacterium RIFCSPHIGHO2_01_FULL_34_27]OGZ66620.1 MAG: hypothetical protein A3C58_00040 [Candidatus Staskawiczbacteria bacterium RIFCSPHIGHO2_02_FULL_34_10]